MLYCAKTLTISFASILVLVGLAAISAFAAEISSYPVGNEPKSVGLADFNSDGRKDLAVLNRGSSSVSILLGDGSGHFGAATNFSTGSSEVFALAIGDFNNDGKNDVVVSKPNVHLISLMLGNGSGSLGAASDFSVGENPGTFAVGDFNVDGNRDLAVADSGFNDGGVYVLFGTGTGSFGAPTKFTAGPRPRYVATGDFNGDTKTDLVVANVGFGFNRISLLLGNGTGGFGGPTNFLVGSSPIGLVVQDFNRDGKLDLAVANADSSNVSILKGDGQGGFGAATNFAANSFPLSITAGDFDGDGKLDLAVGANNSNDFISILRGDDTGQFTAPATFSAGSGPYDVAADDVNGDGVSELAVANAISNDVSMLSGPLPTISMSPVSVTEGNTGTTPANVALTLSGTINRPVTIAYTLSSGGAGVGSDFDGSTVPVNIPANGNTGNIAVLVNGDLTYELDEAFFVNFSSVKNAFITNGQAQVTILNDDPIPSLTVQDASIVEGHSGFVVLVFNIVLSNPSFQTITATAATANGTAAAGIDYVARAIAFTLSAGQVNRTVAVSVIGDTLSEPNETFFLNLTNPINATIARSGVGTIVDDDAAALVVDGSQRAIAVESVNFVRDPFTIVNTFNFSSDYRSRITLFGVDLNLAPGDSFTVQAEDSQHVVHQLPVEFVGGVPGFGGLSQIVVKLPDNLGPGDYLVSFTLRSVTSNTGLITINP